MKMHYPEKPIRLGCGERQTQPEYAQAVLSVLDGSAL